MIEIYLTSEDISKCECFAQNTVISYMAGQKKASQKLAIPGKPRIDNDVQIQMVGRMAEYAMCLFVGIEPDHELNWKDLCDSGYDLTLPNKLTVDVKASSHPAAKKLIWPVSKKHFLYKAADVLVLARVPLSRKNDAGQPVELLGWVSRLDFIKRHRVARNEQGMVNGTPYMLEIDLKPMNELLYKERFDIVL
jgi:hypothetical protein